jgi:hypothetical protein
MQNNLGPHFLTACIVMAGSMVVSAQTYSINDLGTIASATLSATAATYQVGTFTVLDRATSSVGVAEQTFTITATPPPPPVGHITPPGAPTAFAQVFRSANSVTVTWSGATANVGVSS